MMKVPFVDLKAQHAPILEQIESAIRRVIADSSFILGPEVDAFERLFGAYVGARHVVGTASGTAAIEVALMALGLERGDEVIVPAMTFYATAEAAAVLGLRPVFVDIDPVTLTLNPEKVENALTSRTRAILPVHLHGHPADMHALVDLGRRRGIPIVEDCAHAHGAAIQGKRAGILGTIAAFSFYPTKNLGSLGEAGAITTDDEHLAERCRMFRDHGSSFKFEHRLIGINGRMAGLEAAVLAVKLAHLDAWNGERRRIAALYRARLAESEVILPKEREGVEHAYHVFQVQVRERDRVSRRMLEQGVGVNMHYPVPMHMHSGFSYLGHQSGDFPVAERFAAHTLSLPCFPGLGEQQVEYVCACLLESMRVKSMQRLAETNVPNTP